VVFFWGFVDLSESIADELINNVLVMRCIAVVDHYLGEEGHSGYV
jgi:hypothetical protein